MKKTYITPPLIEVISIVVEKGFAQSLGAGIVDYTKNGADSLDD